MTALTPQPIEQLLTRALQEFESKRAIFDLPKRSFWRGSKTLDLSVDALGGRIATPLGPAAGPHTQLAQNLVIAWLAGSRALELKTVQENDRLTIPRPCIDAPDLGYNVEWSQELRLEESAIQYATAWMLIHILAARGVLDGVNQAQATSFEVSVGYNLKGIRSSAMGRFLDSMTDGGWLLADLKRRLSKSLAATADVAIPEKIAGTVTLSTFHGCPPDEIEQMVVHLLERHGVNVIIKLNPTLLGYEAVEFLLRDQLGYKELVLDQKSFEQDLNWQDSLSLFERLEGTARKVNRQLGVKFCNTLVVSNRRQTLAGDLVYLSGPPLHPLAVTLAHQFASATKGVVPISFSGGVNAENFPDTVACGLAPVTTCTDLLRPTGYRRLPRYLKALAAEMENQGVQTINDLIKARSGQVAPTRDAWMGNLAEYAARVTEDPVYHAEQHRSTVTKSGELTLFDCSSCNNCLLVCPNDAFFSLPVLPALQDTLRLQKEAGEITTTPIRFATSREKQWAVYADFCNECGNCDTFCPESGRPFEKKPRFFGSRSSFEAAAPSDGILLEGGGKAVAARMEGVLYTLVWNEKEALFSDGKIEVTLDGNHQVVSTRDLGCPEQHQLSLWHYHALRLLRQALAKEISPIQLPS